MISGMKYWVFRWRYDIWNEVLVFDWRYDIWNEVLGVWLVL
jgi:hypothetical protein